MWLFPPETALKGGILMDHSFRHRHRLPLQALGTNTSFAPVNSTCKDSSRFGENGKENIHSAYKFSQAGDNSHLFSSGAAFNTNPLCFPPGDVHFNPFVGSIPGGYHPDVTMAQHSFRPINGVSHQAILSQYLSPQGARETLGGQPEEENF